MIKGVIFDMDGTLVDNQWAHTKAFDIWCESKSIDLEEGFLLKYYGHGNNEIFPAVVGDPNLSAELIEQYSEEKEALYRELYAPKAQLIDGLAELLEELQRQGIKMAVASSAIKKNVDFIIDILGIRHYFSAISHSQLVERAKPAPDVFLLAAKGMGLKPEECFVFEDAFAGVEAARAAGMPVGVLTTSFPRNEHKDYDILADDFTTISVDDILKF